MAFKLPKAPPVIKPGKIKGFGALGALKAPKAPKSQNVPKQPREGIAMSPKRVVGPRKPQRKI